MVNHDETRSDMKKFVSISSNRSELSAQVRAATAVRSFSMNSVPRKFQFVSTSSGPVAIFLAGTSLDSYAASRLYAVDVVESDQVAPWRNILTGADTRSTASYTREETLLRERQRILASGVTDFQLCTATNTLLLPLNGALYVCAADICGAAPQLVPLSQPSPMDSKFSADGKYISFVRDGDLWLTVTPPSLQSTDAESDLDVIASQELQLTDCRHGAAEKARPLTAGVAEYIIQEEFDRFTGYWWAPTGLSMLYLEVNSMFVPEVQIASHSTEDPSEPFRYPRAGETNTESALCLLEIVPGASVQETVVVRKRLSPTLRARFPWHEYVLRCGWLPNSSSVWLQLLDRKQQRLALVTIPISEFVDDWTYTASDAHSAHQQQQQPQQPQHQPSQQRVIVEEKSSIWVNVNDGMHICANSETFVWTSERTGMRHIYLIDSTTGAVRPLTASDEWQVDNIVRVDETAGIVYFTGTRDSVMEKHLYAVSLLGNDPTVICLTPPNATHNVYLNADCSLFATTSSSITQPYGTTIYRLAHVAQSAVLSIDVRPICTLLLPSLDALAEAASPLIYPEPFTFDSRDGVKMFGAVFKPPGFDPTCRYPTILYVYGGPGVQQVVNDFRLTALHRPQLWATSGFVVVMIDSRGSSRRGLAFEGHLRCRMGVVEMEDQMDGLCALMPHGYIDPHRIGVSGWSYGGYLTLIAMARHAHFFKVGVSGAPVSLWEMYDTGYTERYMDTPANNPIGYRNASVLTYADGFPSEDGRLLIVHGLIDENVHFVHTAQIIDRLVLANKPYELQILPSERHGVRAPASTLHMETAVLRFFLRNL